jgi:hypothetical protein
MGHCVLSSNFNRSPSVVRDGAPNHRTSKPARSVTGALFPLAPRAPPPRRDDDVMTVDLALWLLG